MEKANNKILYIISGVNGAGKSTFVEQTMSNCKYTYLNADAIAKKISGDYSTEANRAAGREVLKILKETPKSGKSIIWETTLGNKTYFNICDLYRKNGYQIDLTYIFLEDEAAHRERIDQRVINGGHDINDSVLTKRFNHRTENFDKAIQVADSWKMLCNQSPWIEFVAFGHGTDKIVCNYELYKHFYDLTPNNNSSILRGFKKIIGFTMNLKPRHPR